MKVLITMPAYNEEKTIDRLIKEIQGVMKKTNYRYKILVVDDGSTDSTARAAKKAGAMVYSHPHNYGLAETFRTEMEKVLEKKPDIIVHIDADGQYMPRDIPRLISFMVKGKYDMVLGSRFSGTIESMPLIKRLGNRAFSRVISGITRIKVTDSQTGFRVFNRKVAERIRIKSRHTYTQEMVIRAVREKFRIAEVPVYFARRREGKSKLISNPLGYGLKAWINIFRVYRDYEPLKFFGGIGLAFIATGTAIGLYLVHLFLLQGFINRTPTLILTMLLITIGIQIVLFGFLADQERT